MKQASNSHASPSPSLVARENPTLLAPQSARSAIGRAKRLVSLSCETHRCRSVQPSSTCLRSRPGSANEAAYAASGVSPGPGALLPALRFVARPAMKPQSILTAQDLRSLCAPLHPVPFGAAALTPPVPSVCLEVLARRQRTQKNGGSNASGPPATPREMQGYRLGI